MNSQEIQIRESKAEDLWLYTKKEPQENLLVCLGECYSININRTKNAKEVWMLSWASYFDQHVVRQRKERSHTK